MCHHYPADKPFGERYSRHYYDLVRLYRNGHVEAAIGDRGLLERVVNHKMWFYRSAPARYPDCLAGLLRLVPPDHHVEALRADYAAMAEMFFDAPPPFDELLACLAEIEGRVNSGYVPAPPPC